VHAEERKADWYRLQHPEWQDQRIYLVHLDAAALDDHLSTIDADDVLAVWGEGISLDEGRFRFLLVYIDEELGTMRPEHSRLDIVDGEFVHS
jgi:hypothetical protein